MNYYDYVVDVIFYLLNYVTIGAEAVLIMIVGYLIAEYLKRFIINIMSHSDIDPTLIKFAINCVYPLIIVCAGITSLNKLGVQTTSLTAIIGVAGLAISLAFQNSMSNLAAGLILIALRPFKIGDYVTCGSIKGTVEEIQILVCILRSDNNDIITMPNSKIIADQIVNLSREPRKRLEFEVIISAKEDFTKAKEVIQQMIKSNQLILDKPLTKIYVKDITLDGTLIHIKPWVKTAQQKAVLASFHEDLKRSFNQHNIALAESK